MKKDILLKGKKFTTVALSGILALNMATVPAVKTGAATEHWNDASAEWTLYKNQWNSISKNYENISLTPGKNASELNFAWYSHTNEEPKVRIASDKDMKDAKEFKGSQKDINATVAGCYSNKVTVTGLEENKEYYYQAFKNGEWSEAKKYNTGSFSNYSILYVGDPQIGACTKQTSSEGDTMSESDVNLAARNDAFNWNRILNQATSLHNVSFMISAGDQVNTANKEEEYAGYLSANALASLPVATTIGNHDSKSAQYSYHYNNPNAFDVSDQSTSDYTNGATVAGSDYYYTYGDVLFIVLDTNNYNCATHENVIKKAVEENKNAKWRIVTFHQDIYGSGYDHSDSDGIVLRTQLTPIMDKYNIDVVLQGHDHTYSRSYQLTGDGKEHEKYSKSPVGASTPSDNAEKLKYLSENNCYNIVDKTQGTAINPKGTVYFEANSATGSKFYNLIAMQQDYISERGQSWTPNYSILNVSENAITVTTYDASTGAELENSTSYTIVKEADKKGLNDTIASANEYVKQADKYQSDTIYTLRDSIKEAQKVADNKTATALEISNAVADLSKAITGLKLKEQKADENKNTSVTGTDQNKNTSVTGTDQNVKTTKPSAVKITNLTISKSNSVVVKWKKVTGAAGYQVKAATDRKLKKNVKVVNVKKSSVFTTTVKKMKKAKKYYVRVRAYANVNGKKVYGAYGKIKSIKR